MDQAQTGPGSGGGEMGMGEDPTRLEASATPGLREKARESVRDAREQVMSEVRERADSARQGATRMVDERKRTLSESVHALASAIDAAAASLNDGNQSRLAEWTRELSGRAHRIASYLEEHDTRGLVTDLEGSARSHPAAFIGTSFAAGLAAGRFLRSTTRTGDGRGATDEQTVDFEFHPDDALLAEGGSSGATSFGSGSERAGVTGPTGETFGSRVGAAGGTSTGGGYGNPGSGYGTTGSSVGATRSGPGDSGFGPTRTASLGAAASMGDDLGSTDPDDAMRTLELTGDSGLEGGGRSAGGTAIDSGTNSDASSTPQRPTGGHGEGGL